MTREDFMKVVPTAFSKMVRTAQLVLEDEDEARNVAVKVLDHWITTGEYRKSRHPGGVVIAMRMLAKWRALSRYAALHGSPGLVKPKPVTFLYADMDWLASSELSPETIHDRDRRALIIEALPGLVARLPAEDQNLVSQLFASRMGAREIGQAAGRSRYVVQRQKKRILNTLRMLLAEEGLI